MKNEKIFTIFIFGLMFLIIIYSLYASYDKYPNVEIKKEKILKKNKKYKDY